MLDLTTTIIRYQATIATTHLEYNQTETKRTEIEWCDQLLNYFIEKKKVGKKLVREQFSHLKEF